MTEVKVRSVGSSAGIILPREALVLLRVQKGDVLHLVETEDGGLKLVPYDPAFARQMEAAEEVMREDRDALRALA